MTLFNKIKWALAVSVVFLLILATNRIDKHNFARMEETVDNIYNDRLLAKEVLMDIAIKFHKKELAYSLNDSAYLRNQNDTINAEINRLLQIFNRLESTKKEDNSLNSLNQNHTELMKLESDLSPSDILYTPQCAEIFSAINNNIVELAAEQVREGKSQKLIARRAIEQVKLFTQIEIYFLIFLGLVMQIIILYKPKQS